MIKRLSIKVTLKSLFLLASMENCQNEMNNCKVNYVFFMEKLFIPFHPLSSKSRNSKVFTYSYLEMALSFALIGGIIAAIILKFTNNTRTKENRNFILDYGKINQLALTLEYNSKIAVREFVFHYTINSSANLKQQFTQIW